MGTGGSYCNTHTSYLLYTEGSLKGKKDGKMSQMDNLSPEG